MSITSVKMVKSIIISGMIVLMISFGRCEVDKDKQTNATSIGNDSSQDQGTKNIIADAAAPKATAPNDSSANNSSSVAVPPVNKTSSAQTNPAPVASDNPVNASGASGGKSATAGETSKQASDTNVGSKGGTTKTDNDKAATASDAKTGSSSDKTKPTAAVDKEKTAAKESAAIPDGSKSKAVDTTDKKQQSPTAAALAPPKQSKPKPETTEDQAQKPVIKPDDDADMDDAGPPPIGNVSQQKETGGGIEEADDDATDSQPARQPPVQKPGKGTANNQGKSKVEEPAIPNERYPPRMSTRHDDEPESSHFLAYLLTIGVLCIAAYLVAHNRHKIMGLILEGRQGRRSNRSGSTSSRGVKYKRLQHEDAEGENGVQLSSRDGGRVIY